MPLHWLMQNINKSLDSRASYGVSIVKNLKNLDRAITAPHYTTLTDGPCLLNFTSCCAEFKLIDKESSFALVVHVSSSKCKIINLLWLEYWAVTHCGLVMPKWHPKTWSTLFEVMACSLMAPNHYLNQCGLNMWSCVTLIWGAISLELLDIFILYKILFC